jgi:hypothetical protein
MADLQTVVELSMVLPDGFLRCILDAYVKSIDLNSGN